MDYEDGSPIGFNNHNAVVNAQTLLEEFNVDWNEFEESNETTTKEICSSSESTSRLTPCVIVDFIKDKVQPCNSIKKLRLEQMVGT